MGSASSHHHHRHHHQDSDPADRSHTLSVTDAVAYSPDTSADSHAGADAYASTAAAYHSPMPLPRPIRGGGEKITETLFSDDNNMMKQITETRLPDGRDVDVKPLLRLVEDILNRATFTLNTGIAEQVDGVEDKISQAGVRHANI